MKSIYLSVLTLILAGVVSYATVKVVQPSGSNLTQTVEGVKNKESVYDRVMRTGKIRCGYIVYEPTINKDPNTAELSGIIYDVTNKIGDHLGVEVEWTEELSFGTYIEALRVGRVDAICAPIWGLSAEAKVGEMVGPMFFHRVGIWVRPNDERFINNYEKINSADVTISAVDATYAAIVAKEEFPEAKVLSLPHTAEYSLNLLNVANGKGDVTFVENYYGFAYLENNPDSLKNISQENPFKVFPNYLMVYKGEYEMQSMLQNVLNELFNNGIVDNIIDKYEKYPNTFYRVAKPYRVKE